MHKERRDEGGAHEGVGRVSQGLVRGHGHQNAGCVRCLQPGSQSLRRSIRCVYEREVVCVCLFVRAFVLLLHYCHISSAFTTVIIDIPQYHLAVMRWHELGCSLTKSCAESTARQDHGVQRSIWARGLGVKRLDHRAGSVWVVSMVLPLFPREKIRR